METRGRKRRLAEMSGDPPAGKGPLTKRKFVPEQQIAEFL